MSMPNVANEIFLDLRGMHPPEPMEITLNALSELLTGQTIHILIDREPVPLFRMLERNSYRYTCTQSSPGQFDILIRQGE